MSRIVRIVVPALALFAPAQLPLADTPAHTSAAIVGAGLNNAPIVAPVKLDPDAEGYQANAFRIGQVIVAGQPKQETLEKLAKEGCTLVVNLRTPEEMADHNEVPFDEAQVLKDLNIEYVTLPLGGRDSSFAPTSEATDKFAAALARHDHGPVLLHCTVAWRASHMWVAYLIRSRGMSPEAALENSKQLLVGKQLFEDLADVNATYGITPGVTFAMAHTDPAVASAGLNKTPIEKAAKLDADKEGYKANAFRVGPFLITGQPTQETLEKLGAEGCTLVVNIRTPAEMDDRKRTPFDETEVLKRLNIEYITIPLGGPNNAFPYTPEAVDKFAAALARHEKGPVLLHCQVAWRASHLWVAYLIRTRAMDPNAAFEFGKDLLVSEQLFEALAGIKANYAARPPVPKN